MFEIICGNVASILASITDSISATRKTDKEVLLVQCVSQAFYSAAAIFLKGYSALTQNIVAVGRNLYGVYGRGRKAVEWGLVVLAVVLGIVFNNRGGIGLLPVLANLEYSIAVFQCKGKPRMLKLALAINMFLYTVFNVVILNYTGAILNCIVGIIALIDVFRKGGEESKEETEG